MQEMDPGGGYGNPLQYSCLENPMDRGAWKAIVHAVTESQTWLKWLGTHKYFKIQFIFTKNVSRSTNFPNTKKNNFIYTEKKQLHCCWNILLPSSKPPLSQLTLLDSSSSISILSPEKSKCKKQRKPHVKTAQWKTQKRLMQTEDSKKTKRILWSLKKEAAG